MRAGEIFAYLISFLGFFFLFFLGMACTDNRCLIPEPEKSNEDDDLTGFILD